MMVHFHIKITKRYEYIAKTKLKFIKSFLDDLWQKVGWNSK